jgi:membrane protein implicated in regulation of membrane protease activity
MTMMFWVIKQILLILAGCFFLVFGVSVLIESYGLKDPFSFVLTFFASNLMILISAAILLGLVLRLVSFHRQWQGEKTNNVSSEGRGKK